MYEILERLTIFNNAAGRPVMEPAYQIHYINTSGSREVLCAYVNKAAAELVISALRAAQADLI